MEVKILIAYATTHGSTQEVAETIAATLCAQGLTVDLKPARSVKNVSEYRAVVLGAPLYMFRLHNDGTAFLARHRKAFSSGLPVAIFAGGPTAGPNGSAAEEKEGWEEARKMLDRELAKFPWLKPAAVELIGGKFDPTRLRFPWNLIPAMRQMPPSDLRDWDAIRSWAKTLAALPQ